MLVYQTFDLDDRLQVRGRAVSFFLQSVYLFLKIFIALAEIFQKSCKFVILFFMFL